MVLGSFPCAEPGGVEAESECKGSGARLKQSGLVWGSLQSEEGGIWRVANAFGVKLARMGRVVSPSLHRRRWWRFWSLPSLCFPLQSERAFPVPCSRKTAALGAELRARGGRFASPAGVEPEDVPGFLISQLSTSAEGD